MKTCIEDRRNIPTTSSKQGPTTSPPGGIPSAGRRSTSASRTFSSSKARASGRVVAHDNVLYHARKSCDNPDGGNFLPRLEELAMSAKNSLRYERDAATGQQVHLY